MIKNAFVQELKRIVGEPHVSVTRTGTELYAYDASQAMGHPGMVVFPQNTEEICAVVKASRRAGIDFIPRGFGTNLSGGTISLTRGLVICLSRMNKIIDIVPQSRYAVVQPGVTNLEVQEALAPFRQFYAPDPASQKVATLGGNAGENSGGPLCLKYGVTSNHILGMEVVMADGCVMRAGGPAVDPPGYDLRGVLIGSEGGFGIITELTLRTLPKAESVITMLAVYDSIDDAAQSVSKIISAGIVPNTLEMMDAVVIEAVEAKSPCGYPTDAAAVLIIEVEGLKVGLTEQADKIEQICMETRCRTINKAQTQADRDRLWQGRRGAFGAMARLAPNYLVNDTCVLRTDLPEALRRVKQIAGRHGVRVGNVFHAGDGNLHPLLLFDSRVPEQVEKVHKAGWEIMETCVELGGTISGEHGIGHEKQDAMTMVFSGDDLNAQQAVKNAFDPDQILNPNKVIPQAEPLENRFPEQSPTILNRAGGKEAKGVSQLMARIAGAGPDHHQVQVSGAGMFHDFGKLGSPGLLTINTREMDEVIEFDPANQFITAGAGMPVSVLQEILREQNQWLPVRPPFFKESSTTGALAATGASGPERMLYGAPRDLALGLQYIDSRGKIISAGGRVVKNVAGYDMTRLLCGSQGSLGVITEVTWRVLTRPELCWLVTAEGGIETCFRTAFELMNSKLMPTFICMEPAGKIQGDTFERWTITVGFEGLSRVVEYQAEECRSLFDARPFEKTAGFEYELLDGCFQNSFSKICQEPFILRTGSGAEHLPAIQTTVLEYMNPAAMMIDIGCSRIIAGGNRLEGTAWEALNRKLDETGSFPVLEKAPEAFQKNNHMFGSIVKPQWRVMQKIKHALDPENLFAALHLPGQI